MRSGIPTPATTSPAGVPELFWGLAAAGFWDGEGQELQLGLLGQALHEGLAGQPVDEGQIGSGGAEQEGHGAEQEGHGADVGHALGVA